MKSNTIYLIFALCCIIYVYIVNKFYPSKNKKVSANVVGETLTHNENIFAKTDSHKINIIVTQEDTDLNDFADFTINFKDYFILPNETPKELSVDENIISLDHIDFNNFVKIENKLIKN